MTAAPDTALAGEWAEALIHGRRTVLPKRLAEPGPGALQLQRILGAAAAAPDHGERLPWRFVIVPGPQRAALGEAFAAALRERDPRATQEQCAQAREKAQRAPLLLLALADLGAPGDEIPATERLVSAGCALQNMLLMATALGFGSALSSGKAMNSAALRGLFGLGEREQALCFVSIGTIAGPKRGRVRPPLESYVSVLQEAP